MQLMTFNSLLMFDIVFVFFLFLVGVTCLVYYLPTGKHHQQNNYHQQIPTTSDTIGYCQYHNHCHYHNHNSNDHNVHHQNCRHHHLYNRDGYQLLEGYQENALSINAVPTASSSSTTTTTTKRTDNNIEKDILGEHEQCNQTLCQHQNSSTEDLLCHHMYCHCHCELENHVCLCCKDNEESTTITVGEITTAAAETAEENLSSSSPLLTNSNYHHHQQQYCHHHRHNLRQYRISCEEDCLDDSDDSGEDIIYTDNRNDRDYRNLNGAPFVEHFVIVNETERALPPSPRCCYVKAKFSDVRECVGPIADV